jgi:NDP-sugar pyrophosphorylase family protein
MKTRGFILAAGLGTRLRPLTETVPKPLVDVAGVPLVERALLQLRQAGVHEVGINLFHLGHLIREYLGDGVRYGMRITWFDEQPNVLGTGGGLKHAESFLRAGGDTFLLANGDVWHGFDVAEILAAHVPGTLATLAVHRTLRRPELHNVGCVVDRAAGVEDDSGRIVHIAGKPEGAASAEFDAIYTGIAAFSTRLLDWLPAGRVSGLVSHGLLPAMAAGESVRFVEPQGAWFDCGTHAELLRASLHALVARNSMLQRSKRATRATAPLSAWPG